MLDIAGRPLLEYVLKAGITHPVDRIIIVISPRGEVITWHFGDSYNGIPIQYVIQPEPLGLADAVNCAAQKVSGPMLVINGDEIYIGGKHPRMTEFLQAHAADAGLGFLRTKNPDRIRRGYAIDMESDGRIVKLVEKPTQIWNDVLGVGMWILPREYSYFYYLTPFHVLRHERDLVGVLQFMIDNKLSVYGMDLECLFFNVNTSMDLEAAESALKKANNVTVSETRLTADRWPSL
jgi:NDP-sugar pyrophosphorylase family protein